MRRFRCYFWWLAGLAASAAILLGLTAFFFPQRVLTVDSGPVKAEAIIVLGGGLLERPARAAELFKAGEAPLNICSGIGDAEVDAANLTNASVPFADVGLEPNSHTTRENAKFTIALMRAQHLQSAIIVTTWYHSRRALACFEHYAPDLRFYSRPSYFGFPKTEWNHNNISRYVKAEYVKMLGYWVCYGVCPL